MERRKFLTVAGATTLAGCGGQLSDTSDEAAGTTTEQIEAAEDGPPYFEHVEITGANTVAVDESFTISVSAANTGGRSGDFTATLTLDEGVLSTDTSVKIPEVKKGTRKSTDIDPIQFDRAGEYTFQITDHAAFHTVTVEPASKEFGQSATISSDLEVTPQNIEIKPVLFYRQDDQQHLYSPDDGDIYVIVHLAVENMANDSVYLSDDDLPVNNGTILTTLSDDAYELPNFRDINGQPYQGELDAGERSQRWLLVEANRDDIDGEFELAGQRDGSDTTPEIIWSDDPVSGTRELPNFELVSFELPSAVEIGQEFEASVTVKNTGKASGSFTGAIYQRNAVGDEQWFQEKVSLDDIEAGASKTYQGTFSEPLLGPSIYTVDPFGDEQEIDFRPATRQFGRSYRSPYGIKVDAGHLEHGSKIVLDQSYNNTVEPSSGNKFVLVHLDVENKSDGYQTPPELDELTVETGSGSYDAREPDSVLSDIDSPVEGPYYQAGLGLSAGESDSGWLTFSVPQSVPLSDVTVKWYRQYDNPDHEITVKWSA